MHPARSISILLGAVALLGAFAVSTGAAELEYATQWGSYGSGDGQFYSPWDVAIGPDGYVYVADHSNHRVQKFESDGTFVLKWGSQGTGETQFSYPGALAVDDSSHVYVTDESGWVRKFESDGTFLTRWQSNMALGIGVGPNSHIYTANNYNMCVSEWTTTGSLVNEWLGMGYIAQPWDVALDSGGNIYVSEGLGSVFKFAGDGTYLLDWGTQGGGDGQLFFPTGLSFDAAGNLFVADTYNQRIQAFTSEGEFLWKTTEVGSGPGQMNSPMGTDFDSAGSLYIADTGNHRIQRFDLTSKIKSIEDIGNDQGRQVRVNFTSNALDAAGSATPIVRYDLFRRIDQLPFAHPDGDRPREEMPTPDGLRISGWDCVGTVSAYCDDIYNAVVPTLADSNAAGMYWTTFFVRAATATPSVFYDTAPDSGYSVDNLSPAPPAPFVLTRAGDTNHLAWNESEASDFDYFSLHRGDSDDFVPDGTNLVVTQTETGYDDVAPILSYYKLAAVDFNGNVSLYSLALPDVTDVPEEPTALALAVRSVSPVRDQVTVEFVLPTSAPASLRLYDVAGRLVTDREVGSSSPGRYSASLADCSELASGVYFVRLQQGDETRVSRVVVLK